MTNELTLASSELPAHLQGKMGVGRGNEDVAGHVTIPRLKLLQKMSDEVEKGQILSVLCEGCGYIYVNHLGSYFQYFLMKTLS